MSGYGIKNLLVEYFRYVALTKNGAIWSNHTTAIISYRTWLSSIWEGIGNGQGEPMPVMFETRRELEAWAHNNNHTLEAICCTANKTPNAYVFTGDNSATDWYRGTCFLWVKANWSGYRRAFEIWLNENRSGDSIHQLHSYAIESYESAIHLIQAGIIFKKRSPKETTNIVNQIRKQILEHQKHHNLGTGNVSGKELFAPFDYTLDGDHVVNKSSLKHLKDAWVLMAPVRADANRSFGSRVERYYPKYKQGTGKVDFSPTMAFKLFASIMPISPRELENAMTLIESQMGPLSELDDILMDMHLQMKLSLNY
ncbi:hypothetical protein [Pseudomonas putida]|uniref:hypothetical protein n=1 Tax=Pseudomonas putida TaxID=303 RepID=UPI003905B3B7